MDLETSSACAAAIEIDWSAIPQFSTLSSPLLAAVYEWPSWFHYGMKSVYQEYPIDESFVNDLPHMREKLSERGSLVA